MANEMAIILHIGASKCGSSALQTVLTENPDIVRKDGRPIEYIAINGSGRLVRGPRLLETSGVYGYRSSPNANKFEKFDLNALSKSISRMKIDIIMSSEGWIFQPSIFSNYENKINTSVEPVLYIRPHVPLLDQLVVMGRMVGELFRLDGPSHQGKHVVTACCKMAGNRSGQKGEGTSAAARHHI